ncbi:hypothetical protein LJC57_02710 [Parabacteroides sp. OttesenSCG-928-G07]|nr:hypothetical protein [Parabacteroides sp. OttesenSCG-928-G07]
MKTNLKDTTFIIPVRVDSMIRLENLILTVECIQKDFDTNIVVLEAASYNNGVIQSQLKDITYWFLEEKDPVFYKTKYFNKMAKEVKTELIALWDVDVILEPEQIIDSVEQLRNGNCDIAYPYDGDFLDTSDILRNHYWIYRDIEFLKRHKDKMNSLYSVEGVIGAVGGAIFTKTANYLQSGMDNEEFYGWGLEDGERHYRWIEFDYTIYRSKDCCFHLSHPRDLNGSFRSENHQNRAMHDFNEVVNYGKEELINKFSK